VRLELVEREITKARLGSRPPDQLPGADQPGAERRADEARRAGNLALHQERGGPQSHRTGGSQQAFERPYFVGPGTPAELVAILRKAFDDTMADPQFVADAAKTGIDVSPLKGAELQERVQKLYGAPKSIIERAKEAIKP